MHEKGRGLQPNDATAAVFYWKGCAGGDAPGCFGLAILYEYGRGVPEDEARAAHYYQSSCSGGYIAAYNNLGLYV